MKRIALLTYGSRGDVEPFVALGIGLIEAGYSVCLAAPAPFASFVQRHGLEFEPIPGDPDQLARAFADQAGLSWPKMVASMTRHVVPIAREAVQAVWRASRGADLIVHSFLLTHAGHTLARNQGVPSISAQLFPVFLSTRAFAAVATPDLPLGGHYRRATHALNTAVFRYGAPLLYRILFGSLPELPNLAPWPFSKSGQKSIPILFAYSPQILPRPADWPDDAHVTGYWQLAPPADWQPPEELVRFLAAGPAPIYFGPGSMRSKNLQATLEMIGSVARKHGQRLCLGVSADALGVVDRADVISAAGVPHAWLFPRMRHIFHHGGAGTTGAAAAAGVPQTAIPYSADQAFWARQISRLGLGPAAPPARRLTSSRFEAALVEALSNPLYRHKAIALGEKIAAENGVQVAVDRITILLNSHSSNIQP